MIVPTYVLTAPHVFVPGIPALFGLLYMVVCAAGVGSRDRAGELAYRLTSLPVLAWLVWRGCEGAAAHGLFGAAGEQVLSRRSGWIEANLICPMAVYQFYNLAYCLSSNEHRVPAFLWHHAVALLAACATLAPFLQTATCFFFGVAEASTVLLCAKNICAGVPLLRRMAGGRLYESVRALFGISFIVVRLVLWPWGFYTVMISLVPSAQRGSVLSALCIMLGSAMTLLQALWGHKVLAAAFRALCTAGTRDFRSVRIAL